MLRMGLTVLVVLQCIGFCCAQAAGETADLHVPGPASQPDQPASQSSATDSNPDPQYVEALRASCSDLEKSVRRPTSKDCLAPFATFDSAQGEGEPSSSMSKRAAAIAELESLPLPSHTVEGYGGGAITPVAYLVNRGKAGTIFGRPAVSVANIIAGQKNVQAFTVTETLLRRLELGYGLDRVDLGTLPGDIEDVTGIDIESQHLCMHNFNGRLLLLDETAFATPYWPSLTGGAHFKFNDSIDDIDDRLHGGLSALGYDKPYGTDFTLTMSKTLIHPITFNRPLFLTVGMRNSSAAQLGVLGFAQGRHTTVESGVGYLLTKHILVNYEFRQKNSPYAEFPGLIGPEDNWHAVGVSIMLNDHLMVNAGWAALGTLANTVENGAWYLQMKYDF